MHQSWRVHAYTLEKNTWRWLTVLHQSNAALHQMGRTDSATFQFFRYRNDNSSSEHIKMYAEYTSNALFRLFVVCLTNVWKKKKNIREKFKKATTTHKKDILVTKDTRRKMRLLKTSTYGVEQHTQFGTIFFVCVSFACSFFLCYYPILCPPARDQHAYTCLFSRVFLSRTAKKQYHDRLLMNVNRYFLRLLNDDISEKKTKKAWASTIMSNVTRRQGHRTLVAKQKKTNYISETTRLEFSKFQAVIPPIDSTARTWRPEIYIRKWWPCVFLCWCNCFEITFRCHIDRMPNIWTILYWTYIHVMIMILLVIMTHASWHRHVICI